MALRDRDRFSFEEPLVGGALLRPTSRPTEALARSAKLACATRRRGVAEDLWVIEIAPIVDADSDHPRGEA